MFRLDDRIGIPRSASALLPLFILPALVVLLAIMSGKRFGGVAIILATIAVAWGLLGGLIAIAHLSRNYATRRALRSIHGEVISDADPVWICDDTGKVILQNPNAVTTFGDLGGQDIKNLMPRLRADAEEAFDDLTTRAQIVGCAELLLDGGAVLSLGCCPDAPLQIWSHYHVDDNIDLSFQSKDQGIEPYKDEFEAVSVALLRLTPDGQIRRANAAARKLLQLCSGDCTDIDELLEGPGRPLAGWLNDVFAGRSDRATEMLRLKGSDSLSMDNPERYFQLSLTVDPSLMPGLLAVLTDVSEMKTLEEQFAQSQKMQAIGQLAGGVAHDFNNLLTAINGHCELLMLRHDKNDPNYADLDQISQNANRAAALVGQLLSFSRKQKLRLERLNLRDILADLAHLLNRLVGERVVMNIKHDPDLFTIRADRRMLEQVIMNLVVNARDSMAGGGRIEIQTENRILSEPLVRGKISIPVGEYICISVSDEGCGIAPENIDKIFDPFFSTKPIGEGTGLGLSTVYGIIKQIGGFTYCVTELGKGTKFNIFIPALTDAEATPELPSKIMRPKITRNTDRPATILLVEDEASVRALATRALRLKGYEVIEAEGGEAALQILTNRNLHIDAFVTDVVMPGMDGPQWVKIALEDRPNTKVVFMSGYAEDVFTENHDPVPNSVFLHKPFTLTEFTQTIEQRLVNSEPEEARA